MMMMRYIVKLVELIGVSLVWMWTLVFSSIVLFGGEVSIKINGLESMIIMIKEMFK